MQDPHSFSDRDLQALADVIGSNLAFSYPVSDSLTSDSQQRSQFLSGYEALVFHSFTHFAGFSATGVPTPSSYGRPSQLES
jgi:hypothetical protein